MKLPKYVYIAPQAGLDGNGVIMLTQSPYCLGKIVKSKEEDEYCEFLEHIKMPVGKVAGYRVCIIWAGTLNDFGTGTTDIENMQQVLDEMADWYLKNKINESNGKGFIRYLIKQLKMLFSLSFHL